MKILHIGDFAKEKGKNYAVVLHDIMVRYLLKNIEFNNYRKRGLFRALLLP
jgi:hypothetical protein